MPDAFRAAIRERILLFDGAIGTMLGGPFPAALTLTRPELVERLHRRYLDAGAEALTTNTFGATPSALAEHGLGGRAFELNRQGAELARRAGGSECFVLGSMGPVSSSRDELLVQAAGLLAGGADLLFVETCFDTEAALVALDAAREAIRASRADPGLLVSFTSVEPGGRNATGHDSGAFWAAVSGAGVTAAAVNCSFGTLGLRASVEALARAAPVPVGALPSAGLPDESGVFPETPRDTTRTLAELARAGLVSVVGGCCGTTPETIAALRRELR